MMWPSQRRRAIKSRRKDAWEGVEDRGRAVGMCVFECGCGMCSDGRGFHITD